jgi:hypothetical protein
MECMCFLRETIKIRLEEVFAVFLICVLYQLLKNILSDFVELLLGNHTPVVNLHMVSIKNLEVSLKALDIAHQLFLNPLLLLNKSLWPFSTNLQPKCIFQIQGKSLTHCNREIQI